MIHSGNKLASIILLAAIAILPVRYADCGSTATAASPTEKPGDWQHKNLEQDWDYLFHPERINQCKPRALEKRHGNRTVARGTLFHTGA